MIFNNIGIKARDTVTFDNETREVTDIINNTENKPVVVWASRRSVGACMPSVWNEWKTGKSSYPRRRGNK